MALKCIISQKVCENEQEEPLLTGSSKYSSYVIGKCMAMLTRNKIINYDINHKSYLSSE
jgi:hypothetical protein